MQNKITTLRQVTNPLKSGTVEMLGPILTNQNSIHEEIKNLLKSENVCYTSVQNLLSCSLLTKNIKIQIYRTKILPVASYGCETFLFNVRLREERKLRVYENRVLRRIIGPQRNEVTMKSKELHNEELHEFYSPNIIRVIKSTQIRGKCDVARMGRTEAHTVIWLGDLS
jgi:hypothetical protein